MGEVIPENEEKDQNGVDMEEQSVTGEETAENNATASGSQNGDLQALQEELASAQSKANEYLDGWQRARAEFMNYKKRVDREREQANQNAAGNAIKRFLDIIDDMDRALKNRPQGGEGGGWAEGIELIYRKLLSILESEGVTQINPLGQPFDPNLEEAIQQEESEDYESGTVIDVVQQGYMLGDRVLRPARVRIAK
jgi:molecular chaperone GrpE